MGNAQLPGTPDLILNCLYLRALQIMEKLSAMTGLNFALAGHSEELRRGIRENFRRPDGLYNTLLDGTHICELGNALAVLTGVADESDRAIICKVLAGETTDLPVEKICLDQAVLTRVSDRTDPDSGKISMVPVSLSMTTFVYDALLMADSQHYREFILSDVDARYGMMLDAGATTFWETMGGWKAFSNAGSLCHGWSALAVYYYHKLL